MTDVVKVWTAAASGQRGLHFWCPGCKTPHQVTTHEGGWTWNGDLQKPTLWPSVDVTSGHFAPNRPAGSECWCTFEKRTGHKPDFKCFKCHSFVSDGRIQFLGDCTHHLASQTVDLPEWKTYEQRFSE